MLRKWYVFYNWYSDCALLIKYTTTRNSSRGEVALPRPLFYKQDTRKWLISARLKNVGGWTCVAFGVFLLVYCKYGSRFFFWKWEVAKNGNWPPVLVSARPVHKLLQYCGYIRAFLQYIFLCIRSRASLFDAIVIFSRTRNRTPVNLIVCLH